MFSLWGCIKENVYGIDVQDWDDLISHILVATTADIRGQPRQLFHVSIPFDITVKSACKLEEVTSSSFGEEICRTVCKSPLYDQTVVLTVCGPAL
jgi:hypothetical protein